VRKAWSQRARRNAAEIAKKSITQKSKGTFMQMAITFMAVIAGLVFSLAVALLAEELIFGQVFRLLFAQNKLARQAVAVKAGQKR
jgi:hypothetical protein